MNLVGTFNKAPIAIELTPGRLAIALPDGPFEARDEQALSDQVFLSGQRGGAMILVKRGRVVVTAGGEFFTALFACFSIDAYVRLEVTRTFKHSAFSMLLMCGVLANTLLTMHSTGLFMGLALTGMIASISVHAYGLLRRTVLLFRLTALMHLLFALIFLVTAVVFSRSFMYFMAAVSVVLFFVMNDRYGFLVRLQRAAPRAAAAATTG